MFNYEKYDKGAVLTFSVFLILALSVSLSHAQVYGVDGFGFGTYGVDNDKPTIAFSCSPTVGVLLGERITCQCSGTDQNDPSPVVNYTINPPTGTEGPNLQTTCSVSDNAGNVTSSTITYSIVKAGGGGSSGGSSTPQTVTTTSVLSSVPVGTLTAVAVANADKVGVEKVAIEPTETLSNVEVKVSNLGDSKPSTVSAAPVGTTYKYLEFTVTNNSKIKTAEITFRVEKSWLTSNNVDKSRVVLQRFKDGSWSKLDTKVSSEDSNKTVFVATTPGFSVFAITVEAATTPTGPKNPTITIKSPASGAKVTGNKVEVLLGVENFELVAPDPNKSNEDRKGHAHVYLVDKDKKETEQKGAKTSFTFESVKLGSYTVRAELHNNDHTQTANATAASVSFTVEEAKPAPTTPSTGVDPFLIGGVIVVIIIIVLVVYFVAVRKK